MIPLQPAFAGAAFTGVRRGVCADSMPVEKATAKMNAIERFIKFVTDCIWYITTISPETHAKCNGKKCHLESERSMQYVVEIKAHSRYSFE
jgi:hypothetical protein